MTEKETKELESSAENEFDLAIQRMKKASSAWQSMEIAESILTMVRQEEEKEEQLEATP